MAVRVLAASAQHHERIIGIGAKGRGCRKLRTTVASADESASRDGGDSRTATRHSGEIGVRRMKDTGIAIVTS